MNWTFLSTAGRKITLHIGGGHPSFWIHDGDTKIPVCAEKMEQITRSINDILGSENIDTRDLTDGVDLVMEHLGDQELYQSTKCLAKMKDIVSRCSNILKQPLSNAEMQEVVLRKVEGSKVRLPELIQEVINGR